MWWAEHFILGVAAAGAFLSFAALMAVLANDYDKAHRAARRRNQAHRKRGHR